MFVVCSAYSFVKEKCASMQRNLNAVIKQARTSVFRAIKSSKQTSKCTGGTQYEHSDSNDAASAFTLAWIVIISNGIAVEDHKVIL